MSRPVVSTTGRKLEPNKRVPSNFFRRLHSNFKPSSASSANSAAQRILVRTLGIALFISFGLYAHTLTHSSVGKELARASEDLQMWVHTSRELQLFAMNAVSTAFDQIPLVWGMAVVILIWGIALALTFAVSLRESQADLDVTLHDEAPHEDDESDDDYGMPGRRLIH